MPAKNRPRAEQSELAAHVCTNQPIITVGNNDLNIILKKKMGERFVFLFRKKTERSSVLLVKHGIDIGKGLHRGSLFSNKKERR